MRYITIALAKGRLAELTVDLLEQAGLSVSELREKSRKLIFTDEKNGFKFILVKASDVPTYVEYGAADIGVAGGDGCGVIFKHGEVLKKVNENEIVEELLKEMNLPNNFIDLIGLSIISDSMNVTTYENRWFLKYILDDKEHINNNFIYELFDTRYRLF